MCWNRSDYLVGCGKSWVWVFLTLVVWVYGLLFVFNCSCDAGLVYKYQRQSIYLFIYLIFTSLYLGPIQCISTVGWATGSRELHGDTNLFLSPPVPDKQFSHHCW